MNVYIVWEANTFQNLSRQLQNHSKPIIQGRLMNRSIIDHENSTYSQENILANSIRIARQKLQRFDTHEKHENNDKDSHNQTFSFSRHKKGKQSSAAQAIKVLHTRIAELEAFNATLTKETSFAKRELSLRTFQLQSIQSVKQSQSELQRKVIEQRQNANQMEKVLKNKQNEVLELQDRLSRKEKQHQSLLQTCQQHSKVRLNLETKMGELNRRIENNQNVIVQMIKQLEQEKARNKKANSFNSPSITAGQNQKVVHSKSTKQKQLDNFPTIMQQSPSVEYTIISSNKPKLLRQSVEPRRNTSGKPLNQRKSQLNLEVVVRELKEKNKQLYNLVRVADRKLKQQQKMKNQYKNKFYSLKTVCDGLVEEINRLPNGLAYKFKCLMVKVQKIQNDNMEGLRSHSLLQRKKFRSKSSRNSSKQSSAESKKSKEKKLNLEDLNQSDHHMSETKSRSKSKRKYDNRLRSHSGKKKVKPIMKQNEESEAVKQLQKKIRDQRKQLMELHQKVSNQTDPIKQKELRCLFEQKLSQNMVLQAEVQTMKRTRA